MRIIGGTFRGKKILAPTHAGTRPTSDLTRETIFNILLHNPAFGPKVVVDKAVLDIFAGTGALGLEAYSRGAKSVHFMENDPEALSILETNVRTFNLPQASIITIDALYLKSAPSSFDLVFLDPPYHKELVLPTLDQLLTKNWLVDNAVIIIEMAKDETCELPRALESISERKSGAAKIIYAINSSK